MLYLRPSCIANFASNQEAVVLSGPVEDLWECKTKEGIEGYDEQAGKPNVLDRDEQLLL
jgi:hypothetical protein